MKILCVSDQIDPLIYNLNASKNFPDIDLILCAGDLPMDYVDFIVSVFNKPTYFIFGNHDLSEFKYYHSVPGSATTATATTSAQNAASMTMSSYKKSETGNPHHGAIYAGFKNLSIKHLTVKNAKGRDTPLLITGISGSIKYNCGLCQYTDTQMYLHLLKLIPGLIYNRIRYGRYLDIFLTHATPFGVHDHRDPCHVGFKAFNWFLKKFKPKYMLHGHIHLYDQREERISQYADTTVINVFAHYVLNISSEETESQTAAQNDTSSTPIND